ncbi:glycogen/starch/alpha-glucan phosphorylase [Pseudoflavonifractor sp. MSJ-30]|uniref:glycogen/starch/alpha-glucan phosphorylase n=1 Tax=Pseudoflavonifractor sp. MSJ-30 TaxID=2841525 RepID=UPI001C1100B1|nr:glycogen/starch/alpha-glucan phosphorylase [Pseudoflavonifractor sp. MSJ-30]MBU5452365.1 glycogen/starch/alpha-glucan phosphorylase [Pseudoflavonifractor sp. MSJ-30]
MSYNCTNILKWTEAQLKYTYDVTLQEATPQELHEALGEAVMMAISDNWSSSKKARLQQRKAYYFSAEYLIGRLVYSNLYNLGILDEMKQLFAAQGVDLAVLEDIEDAALGNGGLGRLAACFLDSAASCDLPLSGYGLRYKFGLFKQSFDEQGSQKENADDWSKYGDPWSYRRYNHTVKVKFPDHTVLAVPYDVPIIGYGTHNINTLRLWQCEAEEELDFNAFNDQDYLRALDQKNKAEDITRVLYPNDSTWEGKRLRIKQQYVLSSASLQDMLRTFKTAHGNDLSRFADYYAVQLNDTHPAMSIPELIRLLMEEGMDFEQSFSIAQRTFSYTNHTVMSEALEKWPLDLLGSVVPEIVDIIRRIDEKLKWEHPGLYIIKDNTAHMANLSVYVSTYVNGVAEIHSQILKDDLFRDWYQVFPDRFQNKTNGVTPRRWMGLCNPELTQMLKYRIGGDFLKDLDKLADLKPMIDDDMVRQFNAIKRQKKEQLCKVIAEKEDVQLNPDFIFDVQVKRLHEYKRQLMNALSIVDIYFRLKNGELPDFHPTVYIFGAKSAPGYARAKAIIRYINRIAKMINNDPAVSDKLKVVFVQNYNCSYAEHIIPAADISEQISPAGTEASGTGNMKLMLNGAVTLGTLDGANVEIAQEAGMENEYIFGHTVEQINAAKDSYYARGIYDTDSHLHRAIDTLVDGTVPTDDAQKELYHALLDGASWHKADNYFVLLDYASYMDAKLRVNHDYADRLAFGRKCLENIASGSKFSSDRTIRQYADEIWHIKPVRF